MTTEVQVKDVLPVKSRISWGAILAGTMTSVAVYFLLIVLGIAIGATISYRTGETNFSMGAAIWAIITLMIALFSGGCVASQCTVGETKTESVIYGVVLWGTMFSLLVWLSTSSGFRVGFGEVLTVASNNQGIPGAGTPGVNEQWLSKHGADDRLLREYRREYPNEVNPTNNDGQAPVANSRTVSAAWWAFGGILLSMLASISGALTGAGPTFTLANLGLRSVVLTQQHRPGQPRTAL